MFFPSVRAFTSFLVAILIVVPMAGRAVAQDTPSRPLGEIVTDLLRGGLGGADGDRRLPFGRDEMQLSFAPLVRETAPAVVNVYASQQVRSPFMGDPFFEQFFGRRMSPRVQSSLGSGVLVDPAGLVVTNFHVVGNADDVKVALSDGREFESTILLKDESLDLAVLKIEAAEQFPVVSIGNSDALEVGDLVLAIGNPFGVGQTTTSGIVSGLARSHIGISDLGFFIQTDAAINPGNSGGALINMAGHLVGINTAIFSQTGGSIGIGFAIPSNMVRAVVEAARGGSDYFERPYLGATFDAVTPDIADALGLARPTGALVKAVAPESPAQQAGMRPGDVVLAMNGGVIQHVDALGYRLATHPVDTVARLTLLREGRETVVEALLVRAPEGATGTELIIDNASPFAGARVAGLSPRLAQRLRVAPETKGVAIVAVAQGSRAAALGFRPGDIVRQVNGVDIDTPRTLAEVTAARSSTWRFTLERNGQIIQQVLRY